MAECNDFSKDFENIKALITCGICGEILTEPKILPCTHVYCLECIQTWAKTCLTEKKRLTCRSCSTSFSPPEGDVANLPTSLTHNSLIQVYNSSISKVKKQESEPANKETITGGSNDLNEMLDWCKTKIEQTNENMERTNKEIDLAEFEVRKSTSLLVKILQDHEKAKLDHLEAIRSRRTAEHNEMKSKISEHIEGIVELHNKCNQVKIMNTEHLDAADFQRLQDAYKTTIAITKSTLSAIQDQRNSPILFIPNPENIQILENLQIGDIDEQLTSADPSKCSVECAHPARTGFLYQFSIVTRDTKGIECYVTKALIDVKIQDNDGDEVQNEITESKPGTIVVKFRAEKPTPYNVSVRLVGKTIQNSPQTINVIDSKAEIKPVWCFKAFMAFCPQALTMNDRGDIAVITNDTNTLWIVVFSAAGEWVKSFGEDEKGEAALKDPRGLTFTDDDHILVSDNTPSGACIKEYHIDGRFKTAGHKHRGVRLTTMCVSGQNIAWLSYNETSNETSLMIFSRETGGHVYDVKLNAPKVKTEPLFITYGNNKYFVSFNGVHKIYVFDERGELLYTIGKKGHKKGQFTSPYGLAVFGADMLLVCDFGNNRVQSFHQDGSFVRMFGGGDFKSKFTMVPSPREITCPKDILVSSVGQIFVLESDGLGSRIHVFR